ncbi:T9SS type A sorting domain-containing protein [bacterium]|nr:T9SS type A sorting domain-containing protein [bacterium]
MKTSNSVKTIALLLILNIIAYSFAAADDRGITGMEDLTGVIAVENIPAVISPYQSQMSSKWMYYISPWSALTDDWELFLSDSLTIGIPSGLELTVMFDPVTENLQFIDPSEALTSVQLEAIERAPAWIRVDLADNLRRFEYPLVADWAAQQILIAQDPYVDEMAFQIAHISPQVLSWYMFMDLLHENVEDIYSADSTLEFVEIIDYGDSNDDDYWSTTRYNTKDENGNLVTVEIDRDTYYWFVVHPKLSDEMPTYIDPNTGEVANPPEGVFWRDYLWNHADSGYVMYNSVWEGVEYLWTRGDSLTDAIETVNAWMDNVIVYGAGSERPIQPVRIYALHCGNCGEFQDLRAAAGRIALIPTACTSNLCEDHVWNEFWAGDVEEWIHWDGANINYPLSYENSGKIISAVFNWRGDGYVWTVSERYSADVCTLTVVVTDSMGKPADGTRIKVESDFWWGGIYYATWGITNSLGEASFLLGDDQRYYLRIEGPLGSYPSGTGVVTVIENSAPGASYLWEHSLNGYTPEVEISEAPPYSNPLDEYIMEINYLCEYESVYGTFFTNYEFVEKMATGRFDFFIANEENYNTYMAFEPAEGFGITQSAVSGMAEYTLPTAEPWYAVLSNRELSVDYPRVKTVVNIYRNVPETAIYLTPHNPPIQIPTGGGSFQFDLEIANNAGSAVNFDSWTMVELPDSSIYGPILLRTGLTIQAGSSISRDNLTQSVPAGAPAGVYTYQAFIGVYPDSVFHADSFTFEKLGTDASGGDFSQWEISGWEQADDLADLPDKPVVLNNTPNPFNPVTVINFELRDAGIVKLTVYDIQGREVLSLFDGLKPEGQHQVKFDGSGLASGIYFAKLKVGDTIQKRKMLLLK